MPSRRTIAPRAARPHQESHIGTGYQQPRSEVAADRASPDHQNFHRAGLLFLDFVAAELIAHGREQFVRE